MKQYPVYSFPALRVAFFFGAGILAGDLLNFPLAVTLCLAAVASFACIILSVMSRTSWNGLALMVVCLSVGMVRVTFDRLALENIPREFFNNPVAILGMVEDIPQNLGRRTRFLFRAEALQLKDSAISCSRRMLVTVKRSEEDSVNLGYGMRVVLRGILSRPTKEHNPGEFNPRRYYEAQGISTFVYVNKENQCRIVDTTSGSWFVREIVLPVRTYIVALIERTIGGEEGEFLKGILVGDRSGIPRTTREAFTNSGVAHILAVSGAHTAVVASILYFLFALFRLPRWVHVIATIAGLCFYMALTGNNPPVVRATIMASIFLMARALQEKTNPYNALGIAALLVLGINSLQLFDIGFQLSFVAVLSIIYLYPRLNVFIGRVSFGRWTSKFMRPVLQAGAVSLAATLGTLPLTAAYFGKISVVGLLNNVVVIPAAGLAVTLGFLSSIAGLFSNWIAESYSALNAVVLHYILLLVKATGQLDFSYFDTLRFRAIDALPYYVGLGVLFSAPNHAATRKLSIIFLVAMNIAVFLPAPPVDQQEDGRLRVNVIDVGQGDAILIEFPEGETMLIDAGPKTATFDAGKETVARFLRRKGITVIDYLVVSHAHSDHLGGVPFVMEQFDVKHVIDSGRPAQSTIYTQYIAQVEKEGCTFEQATAGTVLGELTEARAYVCYPTRTFLHDDSSGANLNNASVVIKLCYGNTSFLFVGDAEEEAEDEMVYVFDDFLQSTLLKVGHHGSITSSSSRFMSMVKPEYAVISVGARNKFHHPSATVLRRFHEMGIEVSRTDEDGAVMFESDGKTIVPFHWRE